MLDNLSTKLLPGSASPAPFILKVWTAGLPSGPVRTRRREGKGGTEGGSRAPSGVILANLVARQCLKER